MHFVNGQSTSLSSDAAFVDQQKIILEILPIPALLGHKLNVPEPHITEYAISAVKEADRTRSPRMERSWSPQGIMVSLCRNVLARVMTHEF